MTADYTTTVHVTCSLDGHEDGHDYPAFVTATSGLVVHQEACRREHEYHEGWWRVTHAPSGNLVTTATTHADALGYALALGPLADWTADKATLRRQFGDRGHAVYDVVPRPFSTRHPTTTEG